MKGKTDSLKLAEQKFSAKNAMGNRNLEREPGCALCGPRSFSDQCHLHLCLTAILGSVLLKKLDAVMQINIQL